MKQNNRKKTWKAIVAVMLVMATLFSISTVVSAEFVEELFEEVCEMMRSSSSNTGTGGCEAEYEECQGCFVKTKVTWHCVPGCNQKHWSKELGTCKC